MKTALLTLAAAALAGAAAMACFIWTGVYDISANGSHTQPVHSLLELTMHRSVKRHAADIRTPPLADEALVARGALCFRDHCVQCHGGPGVAQAGIGRSMQPLPGPLVDAPQRWQPRELYWITRNGIKMSGMPAWQHRLADEELWAVVAFMQRLPSLTAADFERQAGPGLPGRCTGLADAPGAPLPANAERGRRALTQHACSACHRIPGVTGSDVQVGPPLAGLGRRALVAGRVPNTAERLQQWIRDPRHLKPGTAMPDLDVGAQDAADMAAYLATLQ
jgi:mono/diheme cytochrome c family protein